MIRVGALSTPRAPSLQVLSELDCLLSLSNCANELRLVRPSVTESAGVLQVSERTSRKPWNSPARTIAREVTDPHACPAACDWSEVAPCPASPLRAGEETGLVGLDFVSAHR